MQRSWWWWVVGASAVVAAVVVGVVVWLGQRTDHTTTPVDVGDALDDFHNHTTTTTTTTTNATSATAGAVDPTQPAPPTTSAPTDPIDVPPAGVLPQPGVYSYTTTGSDGVDALGGASHDYPTTTAIIVTPAGCGVSQRWVAAEERWDEWTVCATGMGIALGQFVEFHRFFGQDQLETYACTGDPRPLGAPSGTTWTAQCTSGGDAGTWAGTVLGTEQLTVGGAAVTVEHVEVTVDDGDERDAQRIETWYLAGSDLVVRRVSEIATTEGSVIGDVHYTERYEIALDSLTPAT